jgi:predicted dehydrogenase
VSVLAPSPFRILQVGVGLWGRGWAEIVSASRGLALVGIVDRSPSARAWARTQLGVPTLSSLGRALAALPCDAVLVASPPETHRPLAEEALESGAHVVVEKPLALSIADAYRIAECADRAGRLAVVAQNYRFRRQSRALRDLVRGGKLGRLHAIDIRCARDLRAAWITPRDWRGRMRHPYLLDMAIHHVDLLRAITGCEVVEVTARGWRVPAGPFRHEAATAALMTLAGGVPVAYEGTWTATRDVTSWNGDWEIVGSRGRATWTGGVDRALRGTVRLERYGARQERVVLPRLPALDRLGVLHELQTAAALGREPECSARDNVASLATVLALARSAEERRTVRVEEALEG